MGIHFLPFDTNLSAHLSTIWVDFWCLRSVDIETASSINKRLFSLASNNFTRLSLLKWGRIWCKSSVEQELTLAHLVQHLTVSKEGHHRKKWTWQYRPESPNIRYLNSYDMMLAPFTSHRWHIALLKWRAGLGRKNIRDPAGPSRWQ